MNQAGLTDAIVLDATRAHNESHIGMLLRLAGSAAESEIHRALRYADRARRLKPADLSITLLYARLLLRGRRPAEALRVVSARSEAAAELVAIEALLDLEHISEARARLGRLLTTQALDLLPGLEALAHRVCRSGPRFIGWFGTRADLTIVGEAATGLDIQGKLGENAVIPQYLDSDGDVFAFTIIAPKYVEKAALIVTAEGRLLLGSGSIWPPDLGVSGWALLDDGVISGAFRQRWAATSRISLRLTDRLGNQSHVELLGEQAGADTFGFSVPVSAIGLIEEPYEIAARLPDGRYQSLIGSPLVTLRPPSKARMVAPALRLAAANTHARGIDVVIAVYEGRDETFACIDSVLSTIDKRDTRVVVINDASPDPALKATLRRRAREGDFVLLENERNLGYPATVNRGIDQSSDRDVILLNADTIVYGDWAQRLQRAAYDDPNIGTVTPFGRAASITNYPNVSDSPDGSAADGALWDELARTVNKGTNVDIVTGVGFCLFIKRGCVDDVGRFDDVSFAQGYGEENDFCLRAQRRGWRHVAATNIFVDHLGGRSFGERRHNLMARNRRVMGILHDDYDLQVSGFLATDPLRVARRQLDEARLRRQAQAMVLIVTLGLPGGVEHYVSSRADALRLLGLPCVLLRPLTDEEGLATGGLRLEMADRSIQSLIYKTPAEIPALLSLLRSLPVEHIEIHHFLGIGFSLLDELLGQHVPYDVFVHDYAWVCPRITMLSGKGTYCGEPALEGCEACIAQNGGSLGEDLSVSELRTRSARLMAGARQLVAPTRDTAQRLARYIPTPIKVLPWEPEVGPVSRPPLSTGLQSTRRQIAIIGAIGEQKGFAVLLACARDAAARDLPLEFIVFGYSLDDEALFATGRAFVTGRYDEPDLSALLDRERCDLAFFPSLTPETWCFALTAAMRVGLPIVAFEIGAIAERLSNYSKSSLLPPSASPRRVNDWLLHTRWSLHSSGVRRLNPSMEERALSISDPIDLRIGLGASAPALPASKSGETASVTMFPVPVGLYSFTIRSPGSPLATPQPGLQLPAIQVSLAPFAAQAGKVEFTAAPSMIGTWLSRRGDVLIARVEGGEVVMLVTSLTSAGMLPLSIDMRRLDLAEGSSEVIHRASPQARENNSPPAARAVPVVGNLNAGGTVITLPNGATQKLLGANTTVHVQQRGDLSFAAPDWAGFVGQRLWVEAFSIMPTEISASNAIEYCGVTAKGQRTPWYSGGIFCGSKGMSSPLIAFAIRPKTDQRMLLSCEYSGAFVSGHLAGPFKNGELCQSPLPGDALEAIQLRLSEQEMPHQRSSA